MAEECTESSVATSSSAPPNWWDLHQPSSWSNANIHNNPWHQPNPNSNSSCDEDVSISTSFTNASNHSGLTVESSRRLVEPAASSSDELIGGEQGADNHIWSHVLLSVGSNGDLQNHQDVGENFLDGLSSTKSMQTGMFEPACDYLKKLDHSTWEFNNPTSFNNFDKQMNGFNETMIENNERLTKLSNLVSTWSIAPPEQEVRRQFNPQTCNNNISLSSSMDQYQQSNNLCHLKQTFNDNSTSCEIGVNRNNSSLFPCYSHALKVETGHDQETATPGTLLRRSFNGNGNIGYQIGLNGPAVEDNGKYYYGMPDSYSSCQSARNFADVISFTSRLGKPLIDIHAPAKPCFKSLNLSDSKKQGIQTTSPPTRMSGRGQGITSEGKKKRSEDNSETSLKRPKQENSSVPSVKMQAPKVKLGDRITALQQIVSPFGKTDTASVLLEAIQYIKFLQEQVQLLSNPYMKSNSHKDPWGSLDRKEKGDIKLDLRSRGLCLVPISCTPQVYRENTGSDYWTPTYRGCLYR
ncbi:transcription factor bHLH111 isoform X1 [Ziziphus jujuba]|uniref:Transcription factor bHLH111 isoform X1 n=1 Tax=Ziziphus jujuba TaxID=326968 RepID=A0ABM3I0L3_ZIZJJ|nr:transcription factor bHLH111 isoform X1 [Ziziphus jujuba]